MLSMTKEEFPRYLINSTKFFLAEKFSDWHHKKIICFFEKTKLMKSQNLYHNYYSGKKFLGNLRRSNLLFHQRLPLTYFLTHLSLQTIKKPRVYFYLVLPCLFQIELTFLKRFLANFFPATRFCSSVN